MLFLLLDRTRLLSRRPFSPHCSDANLKMCTGALADATTAKPGVCTALQHSACTDRPQCDRRCIALPRVHECHPCRAVQCGLCVHTRAVHSPFISAVYSSPSIIAVYLTTRRGVVVIAVLSTSFASTPNGECSTDTHSKTFTNATCTRLRSATRAGASTLSRKFSRGSTRFSGNASHSIPRTR